MMHLHVFKIFVFSWGILLLYNFFVIFCKSGLQVSTMELTVVLFKVRYTYSVTVVICWAQPQSFFMNCKLTMCLLFIAKSCSFSLLSLS